MIPQGCDYQLQALSYISCTIAIIIVVQEWLPGPFSFQYYILPLSVRNHPVRRHYLAGLDAPTFDFRHVLIS